MYVRGVTRALHIEKSQFNGSRDDSLSSCVLHARGDALLRPARGTMSQISGGGDLCASLFSVSLARLSARSPRLYVYVHTRAFSNPRDSSSGAPLLCLSSSPRARARSEGGDQDARAPTLAAASTRLIYMHQCDVFTRVCLPAVASVSANVNKSARGRVRSVETLCARA